MGLLQRVKPLLGWIPNTGSLLVRDSASQDSRGSAKESDLLGTPSFASPSFGPVTTRLRGRSRLGGTSQDYPTQPGTEVAFRFPFSHHEHSLCRASSKNVDILESSYPMHVTLLGVPFGWWNIGLHC